jgi:hypothetical protein
VKLSREALRRINPPFETSIITGQLPHCLHHMMPF